MAQTRFFLTAPGARARALSDRLEAAFEDDGLPIALTEVDEECGLKEVSLYAPAAEADTVAARLDALLAADAAAGLPGFACEPVPDIDWVARSLEGLSAVRAGRVLVHGAHERHRRRPGDVAIEIEAGLAFGTGHHGTTAGCLEAIQAVLRAGRPANALDLGTGSGVLAIAVARLARIPVLATDIDPVATAVARANVRANRAAGLVETATATGFHHRLFAARGPFDLVVANILAGPLMRLAPALARHTAPGGAVILSGLLARQQPAVRAAYVGQGLRHVRTIARDGWATVLLRR